MKDILINFDKYYINQGDPSYANIQFKNCTTIKTYGCAVCCAAMIICQALKLEGVPDKQAVIRKVIADATNGAGLLTYANISFGGALFKFTRGIKDLGPVIQSGTPGICRLNGHFVLVVGYDSSKPGLSAFLIKDPGAVANRNLAQPMEKYGREIKDRITLT